ncbi:aspartyl/asparaginyl beta-hydroxylase domain-containing protein [Pseudoalteromonas sp. MMG006]|uniref:aspartyl/asparaginyl beta-hydroxylase domain-containing protein n=1 Tax=Pseudoalteromonas sp. MMG006 TaxID=2822683 RepID=UPI001B38C1DE|nr:aspartyl/asparaginyl beta-hydroxylase domain-containing protein [Pseudoalteromonas sp. MMG006]MBQ4800950.1 aspartyl/asparaginyl beta-hydroxylase domain-containing protein [Pseudoalteromonas sp. MMG006]
MITTNCFVFIHMHKTGGQLLNGVIKNCFLEHQEIGYHFPHKYIPKSHKDLPVIGAVRNPWDWYVSWYAFNRSMFELGNGSTLFLVVSHGGTASADETIYNLACLADDNSRSKIMRDALYSVLPDSLEGNKGIGLCKDDITSLSQSGKGYYSWLFERMLGADNNAKKQIIRFESLIDDFIQIMEKNGVACIDELRKSLQRSGKVNKSLRSHYSSYYNTQLKEVIEIKEQTLISQFSYEYDNKNGEYLGNTRPNFRKLSGKANNFLLLHKDFCVNKLVTKVASLHNDYWQESGREKRFKVHRHTNSLYFIQDKDFRHSRPTKHPLFFEFEQELTPILDFIKSYFNGDGQVVRLVLVNLKAGGVIRPHRDIGYSLLHCHRMHLPLITNELVDFTVGGETKHLPSGSLWEINNATVHGVENRSDQDRLHLILDWVPNDTLREKDKKLEKWGKFYIFAHNVVRSINFRFNQLKRQKRIG